MIDQTVDLIIICLGLALTPLLFFRFPHLPAAGRGEYPSISVIIPARNEAANLPLILGDLKNQTVTPLEVICVDDDSTDETAAAAAACGASVISLSDKPKGWTGKSWACQNGAKEARGTLLLFLDADVRLGPEALARVAKAYADETVTLSVQPFHETGSLSEQCSMIFNFIQVAASGTTLPHFDCRGLHGPLILIPQAVYWQIGGHASVRQSLIEDVDLGRRLKQCGHSFCLFVGDDAVRYRMYAGGLKSLFQGWVKNMAAGAAAVPAPLFVAVFFWLSSLISVPLQIVRFATDALLPLYIVLYLLWVLILFCLASKLVRVSVWTVIFYPLVMAVTLAIFTVSLCKNLFRLPVMWKGRSITKEEHP